MMKVLFNCQVPFAFAHGGMQIQMEQTQAALTQVGVPVEPLRWWDEIQTGEILHHFGRIPPLPRFPRPLNSQLYDCPYNVHCRSI